MKKVLSVLLSVLMLVSCVSTLAFAVNAEGNYEYTFYNDDGSVYSKVFVEPGKLGHIPVTVPESTKQTTYPNVSTEYVFRGWQRYDKKNNTVIGDVFYDNSNLPAATDNMDFIAVYSEELYDRDTVSFFGFIKSIFERINQIFEYFFTIFEWNKD